MSLTRAAHLPRLRMKVSISDDSREKNGILMMKITIWEQQSVCGKETVEVFDENHWDRSVL